MAGTLVATAMVDGEKPEEVSGLLRWVAFDFALGQRFLELLNLSLCEVGVSTEIQPLQLRKLLQPLHISQSIGNEIQRL